MIFYQSGLTWSGGLAFLSWQFYCIREYIWHCWIQPACWKCAFILMSQIFLDMQKARAGVFTIWIHVKVECCRRCVSCWHGSKEKNPQFAPSLPNATSFHLRNPGATSVRPAVDGHAGVSGYSHRITSASRHPGAHRLHHPALDLLCRPGAHFAPAGWFQCECSSVLHPCVSYNKVLT